MEGGDLLSLCGKPRLAGAGPLPVWVCESGLRSPSGPLHVCSKRAISEISISEFQLISFDVPRYAIAIDVGIRNLGTISIFSETCQGRRWLLDATINYLLALSHVGHSVFVSLADCFLSS